MIQKCSFLTRSPNCKISYALQSVYNGQSIVYPEAVKNTPNLCRDISSLNKRIFTSPVKGSLQKLDVVLFIVMRKRFKLFFRENAKGCVGTIMIVFPLLLSARSHGFSDDIFLLIFGEISEIYVVSFGFLFLTADSVSKAAFTP